MIIFDEPFSITSFAHSSFFRGFALQFSSTSSTQMGRLWGVLTYCIVHRLLPPFYNKYRNIDITSLLYTYDWHWDRIAFHIPNKSLVYCLTFFFLLKCSHLALTAREQVFPFWHSNSLVFSLPILYAHTMQLRASGFLTQVISWRTAIVSLFFISPQYLHSQARTLRAI